MKDKKAAKKIIKLAKEHPNWYTREDIRYAKMVKKRIKAEEKEKKARHTSHENTPRATPRRERKEPVFLCSLPAAAPILSDAQLAKVKLRSLACKT